MYDNILMNERRMKGAKFRRLYLILYFESHEYILRIRSKRKSEEGQSSFRTNLNLIITKKQRLSVSNFWDLLTMTTISSISGIGLSAERSFSARRSGKRTELCSSVPILSACSSSHQKPPLTKSNCWAHASDSWWRHLHHFPRPLDVAFFLLQCACPSSRLVWTCLFGNTSAVVFLQQLCHWNLGIPTPVFQGAKSALGVSRKPTQLKCRSSKIVACVQIPCHPILFRNPVLSLKSAVCSKLSTMTGSRQTQPSTFLPFLDGRFRLE